MYAIFIIISLQSCPYIKQYITLALVAIANELKPYLEIAISSNSHPIARSTKILAHGSDETDLTLETFDFPCLRNAPIIPIIVVHKYKLISFEVEEIVQAQIIIVIFTFEVSLG